MKTKKKKLLALLAQRDPSQSTGEWERICLAGKIRVDGQIARSLHEKVRADAVIEVTQSSNSVGRGERKLAGALKDFGLNVSGKCCADLGASTGGFTATLLKLGARKVYAVDTAYGELDYRLRSHPQVVVMEKTNACHLSEFPEPIDLVTIDISLVRLETVLSSIRLWLPMSSPVVALLKPQYQSEESERENGEVKSELLPEVVWRSIEEAKAVGFALEQIAPSKIKGKSAGNQEFFLLLALGVSSKWNRERFQEFWRGLLASSETS